MAEIPDLERFHKFLERELQKYNYKVTGGKVGVRFGKDNYELLICNDRGDFLRIYYDVRIGSDRVLIQTNSKEVVERLLNIFEVYKGEEIIKKVDRIYKALQKIDKNYHKVMKKAMREGFTEYSKKMRDMVVSAVYDRGLNIDPVVGIEFDNGEIHPIFGVYINTGGILHAGIPVIFDPFDGNVEIGLSGGVGPVGIGGVEEVFNVYEAAGELKKRLESLLTQKMEVFTEGLKSVKGLKVSLPKYGFEKVASAIVDGLKTVGEEIVDFASGFAEGFGKIVGGVLNKFKDSNDELTTTVLLVGLAIAAAVGIGYGVYKGVRRVLENN